MPEKKDLKDGPWIVIGDIHDDLSKFKQIPELANASAIIVHGDLTTNGGIAEAKKILAEIGRADLPVYAQTGNMDKPEINGWLEQNGINLHRHNIQLADDLIIFGIGGSNTTPFNTPTEYSEEEYAAWLEQEWKTASEYPNAILISHAPPKDTVCDAINSDLHVGSPAVRAFLEKAQPELCICGHIHEGRGQDRIGKTLVINPGLFADGGYALISRNNNQLEAELKILP